jgi:hypothetical protein
MVQGNTYRLEFYQRVGQAEYREYLKVTVGTAQTVASQTTTLLNYTLPDLTNELYINRTAPEYTCTATGTYYFGFQCYSNANQYYLMIDNVRIYETVLATPPLPAVCVSPLNNANTLMPNTTLQWAPTSGDTDGYNLYLGTNNPPNNLINCLNLADATTYDPVDFAYNTQYYWKIVPYNEMGNAANCPVWTFHTGPDPTVESYPYVESFDAAFPPYGWLNLISSGTVAWSGTPSGSNPICTPQDGLGMASYSATLTSTNSSAYLISPPLDFTDPTSAKQLSFWMYRDTGYYYAEDYLAVYLNSQPGLIGLPTHLGTIYRYSYAEPRVETGSGWYHFTFPLTTEVSGSYYLTFKSWGMCGGNLFLDNIVVSNTPTSLPVPQNLQISKVGENTMLEWDACDGAAGYYIWYASDPSLPLDTQNPVGWAKLYDMPVENTFSLLPAQAEKRFYRVTAQN